MLLGYIIYELHCKKVNHILEIFVIQNITFVLIILAKY